MKRCWFLTSFVCLSHGAIAIPANCSSKVSQAGFFTSVPPSLSTALAKASEQFNDKAYCYKGNFTDTAGFGLGTFEKWARDFCNQTHEPLTTENGVYNSAYTQGTLAWDFHLHWDSFSKSCSGQRVIDPGTCYAVLSDIEEECHGYNHGGTMAKDCVIYTFGPSWSKVH